MFEFKIKNTYQQARMGFFNTPHGKIKTPNLAIVATHAKIKLLNKTDHLHANPDLIISNTFHLFVSDASVGTPTLWRRGNNKIKEIKKAGGLHQWLGFKKPIMTDSGGFQVFSLGWGKIHKIGKVIQTRNQYQEVRPPEIDRQYLGGRTSQILNSVKIFEKGAVFSARRLWRASPLAGGGSAFGGNFNDKKYELTPETSIKIQQDLGADIIFAFDECTSPLHSYAYTKRAMERTHRWAVRCLKAFKVNSRQQALFGIVQGGIFEDLRKKSSRFIGSLPFDGFGIGGSFGEKQMQNVLGWAISGLPEEKPRHLLGIGKIKDIFIAVKKGIDLFDCVVPTREARHGIIYTKSGKLAIEKGIFAKDRKLIEKSCDCWVCRQGITRQEIYYLFKTQINADNKQIDAENIRINPRRYPRISASNKAKRLSTIHNIYFFKNLFREIREAITGQRLEKLEKEYYNYLKWDTN